ncbi:hypothetical protein LV457_08185 [Mycobacterium sp. MYCO198283]|uniref:hypothetical protein n=1 Tax=Mycobacterium sp. MYCO198283 TaxID=2883505 RepID=UPI001E4E9FFA|nr:hypothetical protein [Mycobacterium sp. MYCO198283]MCG5432271.1 hypothetical protein [Mycobacterium sp. MYCO198283]
MTRLRALLDRTVSVAALLEAALWLAVPYLILGFGWAALHIEQVRVMETEWKRFLPVAADLFAWGQAVGLWPVLLLLPDRCIA